MVSNTLAHYYVAVTLLELMRSGRFDTDKRVDYLEHYEEHCAAFRDESVAILEIGVKQGESLRLWHAYFSRARIVGLDLAPPQDFDLSRCELVAGNQADRVVLAEVARKHGPFRMIIDDGSHVGRDASASFDTLFPFVEPGGFYVVEDWGTAYTPGFEDGERFTTTRDYDGRRFTSHAFGMAGWLKQIMDDCGTKTLKITAMHVYPDIVFIEKQIPGVTGPGRKFADVRQVVR